MIDTQTTSKEDREVKIDEGRVRENPYPYQAGLGETSTRGRRVREISRFGRDRTRRMTGNTVKRGP